MEAAALAEISQEAERETSITRMIAFGDALLNIVLVIVAGILISREIRRRMAAGSRLVAEKESLETEVAARTAELSALSSHLQDVSEKEKAALARELHDELGGLLVAAKMDISVLRRTLRNEDPDGNRRWDRVMAALDAGVGLKRRVVEQLHPTLLDNMGLYAAIRWQFQESCGRAGLSCTESLPEHELPLSKEAAIAIFRIAQESMTNILKHAKATAAHVEIKVMDDEMVATVRDNGIGFSPERLKAAGASGWASMRHRVHGLGGTWHAGRGPDGRGTEIQVRLPLGKIQVAPA
jgi:signal transduction histidine kinase